MQRIRENTEADAAGIENKEEADNGIQNKEASEMPPLAERPAGLPQGPRGAEGCWPRMGDSWPETKDSVTHRVAGNMHWMSTQASLSPTSPGGA